MSGLNQLVDPPYLDEHGLSKALVDLKFEMKEPRIGVNLSEVYKTEPTEADPEEKTLKEIEAIRRDYLKAGGSDPQYL